MCENPCSPTLADGPHSTLNPYTDTMLRACQHSSLLLECHSYNELRVQRCMRTDCHLGSYRVRGGRGMGENSICVVWTQEYLCTLWCVGRSIMTAPTLDSTNQPKPLSMLLLWCLTLCTFPNLKCLCEIKRIEKETCLKTICSVSISIFPVQADKQMSLKWLLW